MESAAELAMETSKVESAVRNQAETKLNQLEHSKPNGTMTSAKERSESAGTGIEKSAWVIDRRRIFQVQVTVDESVISRLRYLCDPQWFRDTASRWPITIVAPESQFRTCPTDHVAIQEAKKNRKLEATVISRKLSADEKRSERDEATSRKIPVASSMQPVASFAYPVDMESSRNKADVVEIYNPDARYPVAVFEASAVAQSIQSTKKQLLREVL
ncbi:hypothetical protein F511_27922 [Dorcoceras hygrometricum]|uniref:Uncharacterized protein n=1 Tax=Dorcoceras hygrometricum TaxID=472368 RepID=A0A2Z7A7D4_9LAMI|nr:hypothetical protein F511_27922 [Dorcoceras hygrometricum]